MNPQDQDKTPESGSGAGEPGESGNARADLPESESWRGVVDLAERREVRGRGGEDSGSRGIDRSSPPFLAVVSRHEWPFKRLKFSDLAALSREDVDLIEYVVFHLTAMKAARGAAASPPGPAPEPGSRLSAPAPSLGEPQDARESRESGSAAVTHRSAARRLVVVHKRGVGVWWECFGSRERLIEIGVCEASFFPAGRKRLAHEWMDEGTWRELQRTRGGTWRFRAGGTISEFRRVLESLRPGIAQRQRPALRLVACEKADAVAF